METSDKRGPRLAEDLEKDTRAGHQPEDEGIEPTLGDPAVEARSELARYLEPSSFPARPGELLATAESAFAGDEVLTLLRRVPDGVYENVQQVWAAVGGETEPEHT